MVSGQFGSNHSSDTGKKIEVKEAPVAENKTTEPIQLASTPAPTKPVHIASVEQWRGLVAKYFPANQVETALKIIQSESGGRPDAHNYNSQTRDDSWGLYQINRYGDLAKGRPVPSQLVDPEFNIMYASKMWHARGWHGPWATSSRKLGL